MSFKLDLKLVRDILTKFSSIVVTHHTPSTDQILFCYQTLYLLIILSPPIRIPYIRTIIVTPRHHCLFLFTPSPPPNQKNLFYPINRHKFSSNNVTHNPPQQSRLCFVIRLCMHWLFCHLPPGYPISDEVLSPPIISAYFFHLPPPPPTDQQTLFHLILRPNFSSIIIIRHPPSAHQITFCHQTLYLLIIPSPPIRIPYIRSIIVTPKN